MTYKKIAYGIILFIAATLPCLAMDKTATSAQPSATTATTTATTTAALPQADKDANALTSAGKPIVVQQTAHGKPTTFTIRLAANRTTGFQWFLIGYDQNLVKPLRMQYVVNTKKLIGSPGISVWEFQVTPLAFTVPHVTHIEFEYRRPWETTFGNRAFFTLVTESALAAQNSGVTQSN